MQPFAGGKSSRQVYQQKVQPLFEVAEIEADVFGKF